MADVDRKEKMDLRVPEGLQVHQATKVCPDLLVVRVRRVILGKKVRLGLPESRASKGLLVLKVFRDFPELLAPRVLKDPKVKLETLDPPVLLDKTALT